MSLTPRHAALSAHAANSHAPVGPPAPPARSRGRVWRRWLVCAALTLPVAQQGCAARDTTPEATVTAFSEALRAGRHRDAYERLSADYRQRVPFEEFERYLEDHPEEARDIAAMLARLDGDAEVSAHVRYADGQELSLVQEQGTWRIVGNPANVYDQSTPRAAIRSFVRAMERRRYDIVLRFVPTASAEGMTEERLRESFEGDGREEVERLLATLRANLDNPIEEVGERATMAYGEGASMQLIFEDGAWKVEDPE